MGLIVSKLLGGIWGYVIAGVVCAGAAVWATHAIDAGRYNALETKFTQYQLDATKAQAAAVAEASSRQHAQDQVALSAAVAEATAQQKIVVHTVTLTKDIPAHVPDTAACIPLGLIRLLNAAASGGSVSASPLAPGESDDSCAAVSWRSLAADISDDYETGRSNAEQLNALEDAARALDAAGQ